MHSHRPSTLKQQNKKHKAGKHRTKRSIDVINKGRVPVKVSHKKSKHDLARQERRNKMKQLRAVRRDETFLKKRQLGTGGTPPFLVAVISLNAEVNTEEVLSFLSDNEELTVTRSSTQIVHISVPRLKRRLSLVTPPPGDMYSLLDVIKVADTVLLLMPSNGLDEEGEVMLSAILAHGVRTIVSIVTGLKDLSQKRRSEAKKQLQKDLDRWLAGNSRLLELDSPKDADSILHHVVNQKQRAVVHYRPQLIAEEITFEPNFDDATRGTLSVSGYVRGRVLSANRLVHIPGWNDFQISKITSKADPHPLVIRQGLHGDSEMTDTEIRVIMEADPTLQTSLQSENIPDVSMDDNDSDDNLDSADEEITENSNHKSKEKNKRKISLYQSGLIEDAGSGNEEENVSDEEMSYSEDDGVSAESSNDDDSDGGEFETGSDTEAGESAKYDDTVDLQEERETLKRIKEARMEAMFPDEIDTPIDKPARLRFQKYRGLASYQKSYWDPQENLPKDYTRCFKFANFKRTRKLAMAEASDGAQPGTYVTVHVKNVPSHFYQTHDCSIPLILVGLLPHEHQMSLLNMALKRYVGSDNPLKSKQKLIFHVGPRRFSASPIFSQHTNGDKHKFERFFRSEQIVVATVYAPVCFQPSTVIVFEENNTGAQNLVATGTVLSVNPDRIVTKRIVLSGHPFKIMKSYMAVVRYMFFNREDIEWFKPVQLRTKMGRRGKIKDPVGTHGHMKCMFNGQLKSQDTVLMNLYKRVFPKWTYDPYVSRPPRCYPMTLKPIEEETMLESM